MKKKFIYVFMIMLLLVNVVLFDVSEVSADYVYQTINIENVSQNVRTQKDIDALGYHTLIGSSEFKLLDFSLYDLSNFDSSLPYNLEISFDFVYEAVPTMFVTDIDSSNSVIRLECGNYNLEILPNSAFYSETFVLENGISDISIFADIQNYCNCTGSITTKYCTSKLIFNDISVLIYQGEKPQDETETPPETEGGSGGSNDNLTVNEIAIYNALTSYFEDNPLDVVVLEEAGIDKTLEDLTFSEVCLLSLLLLNLGSAILHIIGGRAWNK